jgi:hypothetical protein
MPKGTIQKPKVETRLTSVSMSMNGRKINTFLMLPVYNGKSVLPVDIKNQIEEDLGAERGDTISIG